MDLLGARINDPFIGKDTMIISSLSSSFYLILISSSGGLFDRFRLHLTYIKLTLYTRTPQ